jgi:hypothetical protein
MRDDCLPVAGWAGLCADAPAHPTGLGAAELREVRDDAVQVADWAQVAPGESEPSSHGRFEIGAAFSRHRAGERTGSAAPLGKHRDHGGNETLGSNGSARQFGTDLLRLQMLVGW